MKTLVSGACSLSPLEIEQSDYHDRSNKRGGVEGKEKKGPWSPEEDLILMEHVRQYGARNWGLLHSKGILSRKGKSCHLRWNSKLMPDLNPEKLSPDEEQMVLEMQKRIGNKWATIAKNLNGRTANQVKNFWNSRQRRLQRLAKHPLKLKSSAENNFQLGTSQRSMLLGENSHLGDNFNYPQHPAHMEPLDFTQMMQTSPLIFQQHPLQEIEPQDFTQMELEYQPSHFQEMEPFYHFDYLPSMETVFCCPNLSRDFRDTNFQECGLQPIDKLPSSWPGSYGQQGLNDGDDANSSQFDSWIDEQIGECDISQYLNLDYIDPGPG